MEVAPNRTDTSEASDLLLPGTPYADIKLRRTVLLQHLLAARRMRTTPSLPARSPSMELTGMPRSINFDRPAPARPMSAIASAAPLTRCRSFVDAAMDRARHGRTPGRRNLSFRPSFARVGRITVRSKAMRRMPIATVGWFGHDVYDVGRLRSEMRRLVPSP